MRIGITGASGFLGSALRAEAISRGHLAIPLPLSRDDSLRALSWPRGWPEPESVDQVIHTAASLRPGTALERYLNAELPRALETLFHQRNPDGVFIHISSINVVIERLVDRYTASKRAAETAINLERTLVVRPSLIWSAPDQGPARRLRDFLLKMPVSFMTYPGNRHRPVRVEDLARTIISLAESGRKNGVLNIYGDHPCTLWQLAQHVAHEHGRFMLPIPGPFRGGHLPKLVRSVDYTCLSTAWKPAADQTVILPFDLGCP
jgi:nucleoside-diphosphate-sugar epimerase